MRICTQIQQNNADLDPDPRKVAVCWSGLVPDPDPTKTADLLDHPTSRDALFKFFNYGHIFRASRFRSKFNIQIQPSWMNATHCKDTIPKISNKYSQKRNCVTTVPIPTFMFLWAIYIFPQSVCLFCCRKIGGLIVGIYIDRSNTHLCGKLEWGRAKFLFWEYINRNFFAVHGSPPAWNC